MSKEEIRTSLSMAASTKPNYLCNDIEENEVYFRVYDMEKLVETVSRILELQNNKKGDYNLSITPEYLILGAGVNGYTGQITPSSSSQVASV